MSRRRRALRFDHLHAPDGWLSPGHLVLDDRGDIESVGAGDPPEFTAEHVTGFAVPGMPNLHSHAFQRVLAGLTESASADRGHDSFWTWRTRMYAIAERIDPDQFEAITAQAQLEMLEAGMTSVGEFHYLHHGPEGKPYANPAETSLRVLSAAEQSGIAVTLLPVLYVHGGIGEPIRPEQRRFVHDDVADFLWLCEQLAGPIDAAARHRLGIAPHSLRAVGANELAAVVEATRSRDEHARVHIHIAEQSAEVDAVRDAFGAPPIEWLLDHQNVDDRWCLVHATHCTPVERAAVAGAGAVVGLCPTTEANLGDGVFPLVEFLDEGGKFGIGSDSQCTISVAEELRLCEYGQRLRHGVRNATAGSGSATERHVGRRLYDLALAGGGQAIGQPRGFVAGARADVVVLDPSHDRLAGHGPDTVLDALVFSSCSGSTPVRDVFVGGEQLVRDGRHVRRDTVRARFDTVVRQMVEEVR